MKRKEKIIKKNMLAVKMIFIGLLMVAFSSSLLASSPPDHGTCTTDSSFLFSYKKRSKLLLKDYKRNKAQLRKMNAWIRHHRKEIRNGNTHLAIVAYIRAADLKQPLILNRGAVQANVLRSYIKQKNRVGTPSMTFVYDTAHHTTNKVRVDYLSRSIFDSENRRVYYTLSNDKGVIVRSIKRYPIIPIYPVRFVTPQPIAKQPEVIVADTVSQPIEPQLEETQPIKVTQHPIKTLFPLISIKTNLLYWASMTPQLEFHEVTPNVELEWYTCKHWSVNADVLYVHSNKKNGTREVWAQSALSLEPRYWLNGDGTFRGVYAGAYGSWGDFNEKLDKESVMGHTGHFYEGGVSLGYHFPLSAHWGIEAGAKAGYRKEKTNVYSIEGTHNYRESVLDEGKLRLTGVRLLLTYRFGKIHKTMK